MKKFVSNMLTRRFSLILSILVCALLVTGITACTNKSERAAEDVVTQYLEALQNNDYDTWLSLHSRPLEEYSTPEKEGDLAVISLDIEKVEFSEEETERIRAYYMGSELAEGEGWSDEYLEENMVAVYAQYTVDYDNTKVPYSEGPTAKYVYLIRADKDSPWLIRDFMSTAYPE